MVTAADAEAGSATAPTARDATSNRTALRVPTLSWLAIQSEARLGDRGVLVSVRRRRRHDDLPRPARCPDPLARGFREPEPDLGSVIGLQRRGGSLCVERLGNDSGTTGRAR